MKTSEIISLLFAAVLFTAIIIYCAGCRTSEVLEMRTITAKLDRMEPVIRYGCDDKLRFYFTEVQGWKIQFCEDHPLEDTNFYKTGSFYVIRIVR